MSLAVVESHGRARAVNIDVDDLAAHVESGCLDGALLEVVVQVDSVDQIPFLVSFVRIVPRLVWRTYCLPFLPDFDKVFQVLQVSELVISVNLYCQ